MACLILDLRMPGMGGMDLFRLLKSTGHALPTIFISAHGNSHSHDEALAAGAVAYLAKPFSEEALLQAIRRALDPGERAAAIAAGKP
jgi:two-component system response regulator FixJ